MKPEIAELAMENELLRERIRRREDEKPDLESSRDDEPRPIGLYGPLLRAPLGFFGRGSCRCRRYTNLATSRSRLARQMGPKDALHRMTCLPARSGVQFRSRLSMANATAGPRRGSKLCGLRTLKQPVLRLMREYALLTAAARQAEKPRGQNPRCTTLPGVGHRRLGQLRSC